MSRNEVIQGDGFYISYNPMTTPDPLSDLMGAMVGLENKTAETALVFADGSKSLSGRRFLILNGDFRREYRKRIHSLDECIAFFKDNIEQQSPWSDRLTALDA